MMTRALPPHASLDWLRKTAKQNLKARRAADPDAKLADAQRDLARDHGFASWRALKAHVERPAPPPAEPVVAAFLRAVRDGETDKVCAALTALPALVDATGPHPSWGGRPQPLHVAIEAGRPDMVALLLAAGADVNGRNEAYDHWSPLMLACAPDREEMRDMLLARGARIGLAEALLMKDDARVAALLADGLPAVVPNDGSFLAFARTTAAIDRLLAAGASPDARDHWGIAPIAALSRSGPDGRELVRHMMLHGVAPAPEDIARLGDREALAMLVEADPAIARRAAVMIAAVESGHHELVRWLLDRGADANARAADRSRQSALHCAAWRGDLTMVELLVTAGADLRARDDEHGETPQGWAETAIKVTNKPECAEVAAWLAGRDGDG